MAALGPFEPCPRVAVALSGGADSMALTLLARAWVQERSGTLLAVTVDHGLRPESAAEAGRVGSWMGALGITHRILRWEGPRPETGLQAAARTARYELLERCCAEDGVLHLLVGHNAGDQAETVLMRLAAGSGLRGLAGMASIVERRHIRILRPLLKTRREAIEHYLTDQGQSWIKDPSNKDGSFTRVRLRQEAEALADHGLTTGRLTETAAKLGRARNALERVTARSCAKGVTISPAGYATFSQTELADEVPEIGLHVLGALVTTISGRQYVPRSERLGRLYNAIKDGNAGRARTLGGCRIAPWRGQLLVSREEAALGEAETIPKQGGAITWDGRFRARIVPQNGETLKFGALGRLGAKQIRVGSYDRADSVPRAVLPTLPTIWRGDSVLAVPHLGYERIDDGAGAGLDSIEFTPSQLLCPPEFGIV